MRLTERKTVYPRCDKQGNLTKVDCIEIKNKGLAEEKLCQLEDIEDELGIDLITLFKALKNGVYCEKCEDRTKMELSYSEYFECYVFEDYNSHIHKLNAYGKTWALTKEELE